MFADDPTWLGEAYADPINKTDTGYVSRNLWCRDKVKSIIDLKLDPAGEFLDYAAGYGLFVRMMRDSGYNFRWYDLYCQNLFSRGFEAALPLSSRKFEAVTAFEVFEHLPNPVEEFQKMASITDTIICSTKLLADPPPQLDSWWYYGLEHGQHVSFFTPESMGLLAKLYDFNYVTDGVELHLFSRREIPRSVLKYKKRWWNFQKRRKSLAQEDHDLMASQS